MMPQSVRFDAMFRKRLKKMEKWSPGHPERPDASYNVVDFFCGCGGATLGFAAIPEVFNIVCGIDINPVSLESYHKNFDCPVIQNDVRHLAKTGDLHFSSLETFKAGLPLLVLGCAPCQGFSAHRKKDHDQFEDDRNSLIESFATIAVRLRPDYIVMENVPEILNGKYESHYSRVKSVFGKNGYFIAERVFNAACFHVPQSRKRAIIVASKSPFQLPGPVLKPEEYRTVRDAIGNLPQANDHVANCGDPYHVSSRHRQTTIDTLAKVPPDGGSRPPGVGPACLDKVKGFYDVYGRLAWDRPAITITKTARSPATGRFAHPVENRGLTIREAARLQGFPDGYVFCGGFSKKFEQIGEAVPPPLALALAIGISNAGQSRV